MVQFFSLLRLGKLRQALAAKRLAELEQAARLDLADAFAGDAVGLGHLVQRPRLAVRRPKRSSITSRSRGVSDRSTSAMRSRSRC